MRNIVQSLNNLRIDPCRAQNKTIFCRLHPLVKWERRRFILLQSKVIDGSFDVIEIMDDYTFKHRTEWRIFSIKYSYELPIQWDV